MIGKGIVLRMRRDVYPRCPKCGHRLSPSNINKEKWVCKGCNDVFEGDIVVTKLLEV